MVNYLLQPVYVMYEVIFMCFRLTTFVVEKQQL